MHCNSKGIKMGFKKNKTHGHIIRRTALATAVATVLGTIPLHQVVAEETDNKSATVDEVLVTVRKRQESLQEIPATVQALSEEFLEKSGAHNMEDFARFIPGVSFISYTPGSSDVIFRGITTGVTDFIADSGASVYLDESSVSLVGSQPDVRMVDIAGVQALAGPQGTLYGGSSQAGIMRIQTNKPDPSGFEAVVEGGYRNGSDSDSSYDLSAVVNIPLADNFAIRIVAEKAEDGGFIDNVFGHTPDGSSIYGDPLFYSHAAWGNVDNAHVVEDNWNSIEYTTARISARWEPNEDWTVTFSHADQSNEAHGENAYNPFVGDLQTIEFNPYIRKDDWNLSSLTIEADLGWAQLVSSTSFFKRDIHLVYDTTMYSKYYAAWGCYDSGAYAPAYCLGPSYSSDVLSIQDAPEHKDRFAQEIRLSHQGDDFDWLAGLYYEDGNDEWESHYGMPTNFDYQESIAFGYFTDLWGELPDDTDASWLSTDTTNWKQTAIFGEFTWHINDKTDLTIGGRYFKRDNDKQYLVYTPNTHRAADYAEGSDAAQIASGSDTDFVPKINLSYQLSDNKMLYALYTEGFRAGGTNRRRGDPERMAFPRIYKADKVANYEIGAKTQWLDNTLQLNMSLFHMAWSDFQLEVLEPSNQACTAEETVICDQPWQIVVANAGDAHTRGLQTEVAWVPAEGWEFGGNIQLLEAEVDEDFSAAGVTAGMELPNVPDVKGSAWLSHSWDVTFVQEGEMFFRAQYSYNGESNNILEATASDANPLLMNSSYSIVDLSLGLISHANGWEVKFYINNATDERAEYFHNTGLFEYPFSRTDEYSHYHRVYTNRPREYGVRFKYAWGD